MSPAKTPPQDAPQRRWNLVVEQPQAAAKEEGIKEETPSRPDDGTGIVEEIAATTPPQPMPSDTALPEAAGSPPHSPRSPERGWAEDSAAALKVHEDRMFEEAQVQLQPSGHAAAPSSSQAEQQAKALE